MDRRKFIKNSSVAGLAVTSVAASAGYAVADTLIDTAGEAALPPGEDFELNEITIDGLQQMMQKGEYTSHSITQMYINRINSIDKNGPAINAVIELNPEALAIARMMDDERKANKVRGPLHGIPVLLKDNINTGDKMVTSAGSLALLKHVAGKDAFIIRQLRDAGAVILGKTNLSEWANFRSTRATSGWSSRGGQTRNPYMLDRNPSGSSSGSAAAVAANLCTVAVGTETDGSIIAPSSFCGIVGIKPTVGLLSRSGIIPISKTQDTAGPMARTVRDAAILLGAMTGSDDTDPATRQGNGKAVKDYARFLDPAGLKGKRIGIEKSFLTGHGEVVGLFKQAIKLMEELGATIIEVELMNQFNDFGNAELTVLQYEFKDGINKYLEKEGVKYRSLAELIEFNRQNEASAMPWFKQEHFEICQEKAGLDTREYTDALAMTLSSRKIIDQLMTRNSLDAISATSIGLPCCIDLINGDYDTGFYFCPPAAMAGYPHITVPMGQVHELPAGISFMAGAFKEADILAIAYAYEQASKKRRSPEFIPTAVNR
jgi:amidase